MNQTLFNVSTNGSRTASSAANVESLPECYELHTGSTRKGHLRSGVCLFWHNHKVLYLVAKSFLHSPIFRPSKNACIDDDDQYLCFDFSNEQFYFAVVGCLGLVVFILGAFYFAVIHKFQKGPIFKKGVNISYILFHYSIVKQCALHLDSVSFELINFALLKRKRQVSSASFLDVTISMGSDMKETLRITSITFLLVLLF